MRTEDSALFVKWFMRCVMLLGAVWLFAGTAIYFAPSSPWAYELRNEAMNMKGNDLEYWVHPQPSDCAFWTAPLGSKRCHYEPVITHSNPDASWLDVFWIRVDD